MELSYTELMPPDDYRPGILSKALDHIGENKLWKPWRQSDDQELTAEDIDLIGKMMRAGPERSTDRQRSNYCRISG